MIITDKIKIAVIGIFTLTLITFIVILTTNNL
jgi:hypothetical protein